MSGAPPPAPAGGEQADPNAAQEQPSDQPQVFEEELDRGPCDASSILGFTCQKAHVGTNGTDGVLRIHWNPFKQGGAFRVLTIVPCFSAVCCCRVMQSAAVSVWLFSLALSYNSDLCHARIVS